MATTSISPIDLHISDRSVWVPPIEAALNVVFDAALDPHNEFRAAQLASMYIPAPLALLAGEVIVVLPEMTPTERVVARSEVLGLATSPHAVNVINLLGSKVSPVSLADFACRHTSAFRGVGFFAGPSSSDIAGRHRAATLAYTVCEMLDPVPAAIDVFNTLMADTTAQLNADEVMNIAKTCVALLAPS